MENGSKLDVDQFGTLVSIVKFLDAGIQDVSTRIQVLWDVHHRIKWVMKWYEVDEISCLKLIEYRY